MVAAVGAAAAIGGSLISANAAGDAADTQAGATRDAAELQARAQEQNRQDMAPWRDTGAASLRKLSSLLGLGGAAGGGSGGGSGGVSREQIYNQLLPQYSRASPGANGAFLLPSGQIQITQTVPVGFNSDNDYGRYEERTRIVSPDEYGRLFPGSAVPGQSEVDYNALNQAVDRQYSSQGGNNTVDPEYGSLLRNFSLQDFEKDPGYEFRLAEGEKGINRAAAARGGYDSGSTLKALLRYGSDYASGEFSNAYNRDASNKARTFNFLSGVAGTGQSAANTITNQNQTSASNLGNLAMAGGEARAAGMVGSSNALSSGLSGAFNNYQQNQTLQRLMNNQNSLGYTPSYANTGNPGGWNSGYDL